MRVPQAVAATTLLAALASAPGCTPADRTEFDREVTRWAYQEVVGPVHAAYVVGTAAPAGGPAGWNAVIADYGLRVFFASKTDSKALPPSPWEVPDPNRPVQIGPAVAR